MKKSQDNNKLVKKHKRKRPGRHSKKLGPKRQTARDGGR
jgi:hypothetical protein